MPTSLIIVALVVAWLLVLVPIVARRRQEVARTADSTLAARVVRRGGVRVAVEEEPTMSETGTSDTERDEEFEPEARRSDEAEAEDEFPEEFSDEFSDDVDDLAEGYLEGHRSSKDDDASDSSDFSDDDEYFDDDDVEAEYEPRRSRPYRPGRGGFDPEAAAIAARAKYAFRQRVVLCMLLVAIITAVVAIVAVPLVWWAHAIVDVSLVGYLTYLRRQVRIEDEIRQRRTARLGTLAPAVDEVEEDAYVDEAPVRTPVRPPIRPSRPRPGTVVVEADDDDPMFDDLAEPDVLPYRRAVGE